jgi:O-antigen ligase
MSLALHETTPAAFPLRAPFTQRLERWFFIFVLLYAAGALVQLAVQGPVPLRGVVAQDSAPLRAIWGGCYVIFGGIALYHLSLYAYVLRAQPTLLALCGFMLLSALWSADPMTSLQHSATVVIGMAIGAYLGMRYGAEGVVRLLAVALAIAMVTSLGVMIFMPRWGTMMVLHKGAWLGVFSHKNALGMMSLLAILCFGYLGRQTPRGRRLGWWILLAVALVLLAGSGSATSIVGLLILGACAYGLRLFQRSSADITLALTGLAAIGLGLVPVLFLALDAVLPAFGRDLTFTGRTDLWALGFDSLLHRPLLGFGFDSFWDDHSGFGGAQIRSLVGWTAPHVHNSWLELALGIGIIGLSLFASLFARTLVRAIRLLRLRAEPIDGFVALFMLYLCLYSFDEQVFLVRNDVLTLVLMAFATATLIDLRALANRPAQPGVTPVELPDLKLPADPSA